MTIKLIAYYGSQPPGTAFTGDPATEAALVAAGQATTDMTGAAVWAPALGTAKPASPLAPAQIDAQSSVGNTLDIRIIFPPTDASFSTSRTR